MWQLSNTSLKPRTPTTFSLAIKMEHLKNNSVTRPNVGKNLYFISLSSCSPSLPLSWYSLHATGTSSAALWFVLLNIVNFYLLFSNHKPNVPFVRYAWDKQFHLFSLLEFWVKKHLVPKSCFPPWKCTELSRFCCGNFFSTSNSSFYILQGRGMQAVCC